MILHEILMEIKNKKKKTNHKKKREKFDCSAKLVISDKISKYLLIWLFKSYSNYLSNKNQDVKIV